MSALAPQGLPPAITIGGPGAGPVGPNDGPGPSDGDWEQDLQAAIAALRELVADAHDHVEANVVDKCIAALSALTAKRQQAHESALGVTPAHKAMSRAY
jgi:hypothetical protein